VPSKTPQSVLASVPVVGTRLQLTRNQPFERALKRPAPYFLVAGTPLSIHALAHKDRKLTEKFVIHVEMPARPELCSEDEWLLPFAYAGWLMTHDLYAKPFGTCEAALTTLQEVFDNYPPQSHEYFQLLSS
jgi:hypothetical protein